MTTANLQAPTGSDRQGPNAERTAPPPPPPTTPPPTTPPKGAAPPPKGTDKNV
jgi:hypothetical protein